MIAVDHEPLSFWRRNGYARVDEAERFEARHAESTIEAAAANGLNVLRAHFYKGAGYESEREERERVHELRRLCTKHGVRLQLYIQFGTIDLEIMRDEQPDVLDWVQKDKHGNPLTLVYGHQSFRSYPCFSTPGYWDYLEDIIRDCVTNYGPDLIGYDNITTGEEPEVCHCTRCHAAFTAYLVEKYDRSTPEGLERCRERFGHTLLENIRPPEWNYQSGPFSLNEITLPTVQEWVQFRTEYTAKMIERITGFTKALNPDVLIELNAYKLFGDNTAFVNGLYLPDFLGSIDLFWNECDPEPAYAADGLLQHRIRSYKMAAAYGKLACTMSDNRRGFAEVMAFNRGTVNGIAFLLTTAFGDMTIPRSYQRFSTAHRELYAADPIGRIALFESRASLSNSNYDVWYADILMHNLLLSRHVPYDMIFDLDRLSQYAAVILPEMRCLTDAEVAALVAYAKAGGVVLLTGQTGDFDEWHRVRGHDTLRELLGVKGNGYRELYTTAVGKGTAMWCPTLTSPADSQREMIPEMGEYRHVRRTAWYRPDQAEAVSLALRAAVSLPVDIDAPPSVVSEVTEDDENLYVHLVNFAAAETSSPIGLTCRDAAGATLLDVDGEFERGLEPEADGRYLIDSLRVYNIVRFRKA